MRIASITTHAVGAALGGLRNLASRQRPRSDDWVVECPETDTTAAITLDAAGRLTGCSHWPEGKYCDRRCVG